MTIIVKRLDRDRWVLLIDDSQAGLYATDKAGKAAARRMIRATAHLKWHPVYGSNDGDFATDPVWIGKIS